MMRFLRRLFGRPYEIVEHLDVQSVEGIYAAFQSNDRCGNETTELRLTPKAYAWLCEQLKRDRVTHVAGVPVRVIEVANA
jgi:hypothetical protein